jgi:hypothetical protein
MATFTMAQGDTLPVITDTLSNADGTPIDLTGSAVHIRIRARHGATALADSTATIVSPSAGTVSYTVTAPQALLLTKGLYLFNWHIIFGDGTKLTVPNGGANTLWITENLA